MVEKIVVPAIYNAIEAGDTVQLKLTINEFPDYIDYITPFAGGTWLHYAARQGNIKVVNCLLDLGFDPNKVDSLDGGLPIVRASHGAHVDVVLRLLRAGSCLEVSGADSASNPLFAAIQGGSIEIVKTFLDAGIDTSRTYGEKDNIDALAFAILYGQTEIAQVLALHKANNNPSDAETLILQAKEAIKPIGGLKQVKILPDT